VTAKWKDRERLAIPLKMLGPSKEYLSSKFSKLYQNLVQPRDKLYMFFGREPVLISPRVILKLTIISFFDTHPCPLKLILIEEG
jgi:hypothetical protein